MIQAVTIADCWLYSYFLTSPVGVENVIHSHLISWDFFIFGFIDLISLSVAILLYIVIVKMYYIFYGNYNYDINYNVIISLPNTYVFLLMLWISEDLSYRFNSYNNRESYSHDAHTFWVVLVSFSHEFFYFGTII